MFRKLPKNFWDEPSQKNAKIFLGMLGAIARIR